jgi:hypothetical protein
MSYDLELYFEPAIRRSRILEYFAARKHFKVENDKVVYGHEDTGVYFFMRLRSGRNILLQITVAAVEFEINYGRPSYFGIEAEKEMAAFVAAFQPRLHDPQMRGMGDGPYSRDGFLNGWNFGNVFAVYSALARDPDWTFTSLPADELRADWKWNYHSDERHWRRPSSFVPIIMYFRIEGRLSRVAVWPTGSPILLPRVDYVLIGRVISGEKRYGLASWSEVLNVIQRASLDTAKDPLDIAYLTIPPPIANWVANIPLIDVEALERVRPDQILDEELIAAARDFKRDHVAKSDGA